MTDLSRIRDCLVRIYGEAVASRLLPRIEAMLERHRLVLPPPVHQSLSEYDAILISYPDQVQEDGKAPLACLNAFAAQYLHGLVTGIHLLPFYPSSSDDGFSVVDYKSVDPAYGDWGDIRKLGGRFQLMFDAVINHASARSKWFQGFLQDEAPYKDFFVLVAGTPDLSAVVRPRTHPVLTSFATAHGEQAVWTTFSADQVDLDYHNPEVLLRMLELILFYVEQGARFIRLDAVAYVWKEIGTTCIHRPQAHWIVRLLRAVLDEVAPDARLLTETNVPQDENLSYLGDGTNEAHLAYNFGLPPLVLHAYYSGQARTLSEWAAGLRLPSPNVALFNVLATHDGIGLNGARGILSDREIQEMADRIRGAGGEVSARSNPDGSTSPYELNINYFDALQDPESGSDLTQAVSRFLGAHAIMLSFTGMPGIYFHSMFGTRGWREGALQSGQARTINREKLQRPEVSAQLAEQGSLRSLIYAGMKRLLQARRRSPSFSPHAEQRVVHASAEVFAFTRTAPDHGEEILCIHNVTSSEQRIACGTWHAGQGADATVHDLIGGGIYEWAVGGHVRLQPYQAMWLRIQE